MILSPVRLMVAWMCYERPYGRGDWMPIWATLALTRKQSRGRWTSGVSIGWERLRDTGQVCCVRVAIAPAQEAEMGTEPETAEFGRT